MRVDADHVDFSTYNEHKRKLNKFKFLGVHIPVWLELYVHVK